ncbi:MAG: VOC family protein [Verrucomicrobiota bacterium]
MPNPFVHAELATTSLPKAKALYSKMFAWKLNNIPSPVRGGKYTMVDVGKIKFGSGGGMMPQCIPNAPSAWMPYVEVKDIDAATKKAKDLHARILKSVTEVPDMGWLSIIQDPTGAMLRLWEPKN